MNKNDIKMFKINKQKTFIIVYTEEVNPNSNKHIIECYTSEELFLRKMELQNKAWNIKTYKEVTLDIQAI